MWNMFKSNTVDLSERNKLMYEALYAHRRGAWEATNEFAQTLIRYMFLASSGAIIATLTFYGNVIKNGMFNARAIGLFSEIKYSMLLFIFSMLVVVLSLGFRYFAQHRYAEVEYTEDAQGKLRPREIQILVAKTLNLFSVVALAASVGLFAWGAWSALEGLELFGQAIVVR